MMYSSSYETGLSSFEWFELAMTAAASDNEKCVSYDQNGLYDSAFSTAEPSRSCSSILDPLPVPIDNRNDPTHLDIDPILLHALLQISEEDVACQVHSAEKTRPVITIPDDQSMRSEAEKDFQTWKQTRRLIKRLSRNDSWDVESKKSGYSFST